MAKALASAMKKGQEAYNGVAFETRFAQKFHISYQSENENVQTSYSRDYDAEGSITMAYILNLQEGENGLEALKELSVPETAALIVYAAGKDINEGFTLEKARQLIAFMDMQSVSEILNTFNESTGFDMEKLTDDQKKTILKMLRSTLM